MQLALCTWHEVEDYLRTGQPVASKSIAADPELAGLAARRERLQLDSEHHGSPSGWLSTHVEALRAAGFSEVGTLWQRGNNRILCGVRGG